MNEPRNADARQQAERRDYNAHHSSSPSSFPTCPRHFSGTRSSVIFPFLITALADALEITQEEADELSALAKEHGTSGATLEERVDALEQANDDIILMMADLIGG